MPHGGPISRDYWRYNFLAQMLANRGYAVLQMNFRGSHGYGNGWFSQAHQDWGGLTYDDVIDGARWAAETGIADPQRMAILGWSFGGYVALLGAVRNNDLFQWSVSIAGVSDLPKLLWDERRFISSDTAREQLGRDFDKLKNDSPLRFAEDVDMPILLVHGDADIPVDIGLTKAMVRALKKANKPHEVLILKDAGHSLLKEPDRLAMLQHVERFLGNSCFEQAAAAAAN